MSLVLTTLLVWLAVVLLCYVDHRLPAPKDRGARLADFSEARAYPHLKKLVEVSPRPVYSRNHGKAYEYIKSTLDGLASSAAMRSGVKVEVLEDVATGQYKPLTGSLKSGHLTYSDLPSVALRVAPAGWEAAGPGHRHAIMVSVHIDGVPTGPAAGDNGQAIATHLELARALVDKPPKKHAVVFLFNTGEEEGLLGAHAFCTHHPWKDDVRAFVNVEAMGAGGRHRIIQVTDNSTWLVGAYARAAPRPSGVIAAQEIFDSGIVASDTDYRVFRDICGYAGMDLATVDKGSVYHTPHDTIDKVDPGSMQYLGDNLLGLLREVTSDEEMLPRRAVGAHKEGRPVFIDFLGGAFMLVYRLPDAPALFVTAVVGAASLAALRWSVLPQRLPSRALARGMVPAALAGLFIVALSWATTVVFSVLLAIPTGAFNPLGLLGAPRLVLLMHVCGGVGAMSLVQWIGNVFLQSLLEPLEPLGLDDTRSVAQGVLYGSTVALLAGAGGYLTYAGVASGAVPLLLAVLPLAVGAVLQPAGTGEKTAPPAPSSEEKNKEWEKYKEILERQHKRRQEREAQGIDESDEEDENELEGLPKREEADASRVGVKAATAVGMSVASVAVAAPSGHLFLGVMQGMCRRLIKNPGKGALWLGDLLQGVGAAWLVFAASIYLVPFLVCRQKSGPGGRMSLLLLLVWAVLVGISVSGKIPPFSEENPRQVNLYHVHDAGTGASFVALASASPGEIAPVAAAQKAPSAEFSAYGKPLLMCSAKRRSPEGQVDLVSQLLKKNCQTMPGDAPLPSKSAAMAPSLERVPGGWTKEKGLVAVRMATGTSQRWILGLHPDQVASFAISLGSFDEADVEKGPFFMPWHSVGRGEADWLPWYTVFHLAAGAPGVRPQEFTLWLRLRTGPTVREADAVRLRADYPERTWAWRWVESTLPGDVALFHKLRQPLAFTSHTTLRLP